MRSFRVAVVAASAVAIAASAGISLAGTASGSAVTSTHRSVSFHQTEATGFARAGVSYSKLERVCPPARPGQVTCFAIRRVPLHVAVGAKLPPGAVADPTPPPGFTAGPAGGYTPGDLGLLYNFDRTSGGTGQTIGIIDWYSDPNVLEDLDHFDSYYGFPAETADTFAVLNQNGAASPLPKGNADSAGEITLDVQSARATCASCRIVLIEANSPSNANIAKAEDEAVTLGATEISNSFGGPEHGKASKLKTYAKAFDHPGVVITASTGDEGWYSWDLANTKKGKGFSAANIPSTFPTVTAVGGTSVGYLKSTGDRAEYPWDSDGEDDSAGIRQGQSLGASGGGCSRFYAAPGWQSATPGYARMGCNGERLGTDIAAVADPATGFDIYDSYGSGGQGWETVGGTSLSSPFIASLWALAGGAQGVANPTVTLYSNYASAASTDLYDVTQGGNGLCGGDTPKHCNSKFKQNVNTLGLGRLDCSWSAAGKSQPNNRQCNAAVGFDGPTGVGTPDGLGVFTPDPPTATISGPTTVQMGDAVSFTAGLKDPAPGGTGKSWAWTSSDGGSGDTRTFSHTFRAAGMYTLTLSAKDNYGDAAAPVTMQITVQS